MSEREFTIQDMISAAISQTPSEFQNAFNSVILNKVADNIAAQKEIVAKDYFNKFSDDDQVEEDEEDDLENESSDDQEENENEDVETNS